MGFLSEWWHESERSLPEYSFELLITVHFRSIFHPTFKASSFGSLDPIYAQKTASRLKRSVENKWAFQFD